MAEKHGIPLDELQERATQLADDLRLALRPAHTVAIQLFKLEASGQRGDRVSITQVDQSLERSDRINTRPSTIPTASLDVWPLSFAISRGSRVPSPHIPLPPSHLPSASPSHPQCGAEAEARPRSGVELGG